MSKPSKTIDRLAALQLLSQLNRDILSARTQRADEYNAPTPKATVDAFVKEHQELIGRVKRALDV